MKKTVKKIYLYLRRGIFAGRGLSKIAFLKNASFAIEKFVGGSNLQLEDGEPSETIFIQENLKVGDTFIDIGANIGWYTLVAAKIVGPSGKVHAFEPDKRNLEVLARNTKDLPNVEIIPKAVAEISGTKQIFIRDASTVATSFYDPTKDADTFIKPFHSDKTTVAVESIEIDAVSLDEYFGSKPIDMIKMDVEGAEFLVVQGAQKVLSNEKIVVVSEFCPAKIQATGGDARQFLQSFIDLKFSIFEIDERHQALAPRTIDQLLSAYTFEKNNGTNLVFKRI